MRVERRVLRIHEQIFEDLNDYLKKGKDMSIACLISMILYAVQFGGIEESLGGLFTELVVRNCMDAPSKLVRAVIALIAMENDGGIVFERTRKMVKDGLKELPSLYRYKEFVPTPSNVWIDKANFNIRVRDTYEDGKRCLGNYFYKTLFTKPIYVDTENAYQVLPHGSKIALVTFCDADMKTVLLWRIHKHTREEVQKMKKLIVELSKIRKFAAFGREEFFDPIPLADFDIGGTSLKSLATSHGIEISKTETMSDWTAEELRDDQIQYAAFDAVVLHLLHQRVDPISSEEVSRRRMMKKKQRRRRRNRGRYRSLHRICILILFQHHLLNCYMVERYWTQWHRCPYLQPYMSSSTSPSSHIPNVRSPYL